MNAAAFKATFSDFRLIKGRKQAQFVFEVPLEQADKALECLGGVPRPDNETWVGIARLAEQKAEPKPQEPKARKRFDELPLSQQCALRCADTVFQFWCNVATEQGAADRVRSICGIQSRAELDSDERAARLWKQIEHDFLTGTGRIAEQRG